MTHQTRYLLAILAKKEQSPTTPAYPKSQTSNPPALPKPSPPPLMRRIQNQPPTQDRTENPSIAPTVPICQEPKRAILITQWRFDSFQFPFETTPFTTRKLKSFIEFVNKIFSENILQEQTNSNPTIRALISDPVNFKHACKVQIYNPETIQILFQQCPMNFVLRALESGTCPILHQKQAKY